MILLNSSLLEPKIGLLFWMTVVFGILIFLLRKFAWKPILEGLKEREGEIEGALRMAEETRAEMAKLKSDNDKILAEARLERDLIIKEAKDAAERILGEAKADAQQKSEKIVSDTRAMLTQEKDAMIAQVKNDVASLSIEIAEKVLRKELSDKAAQQTYVDSLVSDARLN